MSAAGDTAAPEKKPADLISRLDGVAGIVDMAWREITPDNGHLGSALWLAAQELSRMRDDLEAKDDA